MRVLVECYPDAAVVGALGVTRRQLRHERCKGEVVKKILKSDDALGVVDEDPGSAQPRDLAAYEEVQSAAGLRLLARRGDTGRTLVLVCPRLEEWLIQRAKSLGLKLEDYGLPGDPDRLHSIPRYEQRQEFHLFLGELMSRDTKGMGVLRQWVHPGG